MTNMLELNLVDELTMLKTENTNIELIIEETLEDQQAASDALSYVRKLDSFVVETKAKLETAQSQIKVTSKLDTIVSLYEANIAYAENLIDQAKVDDLYQIALNIEKCAGLDKARVAKDFYTTFETFLVEKRQNLGKLTSSVNSRLTDVKGKEKTKKWNVVQRELISNFIMDEFPESLRYQNKETHEARITRACRVGGDERHEFMMKNSEGYRKDHEEKLARRERTEKERATRRKFDNAEDAEEYVEGGEVAELKFGIEDSPRRQKAAANVGTTKQGIERGLSDDDMVNSQ